MHMSDFDEVVQAFFKNYQDRKMKKWMGFYLSDHTVVINKDKKRRQTKPPHKTAMTQEEIGVQLLKAYSNHRLVHLQTKIIDEDNQLSDDIVGFVVGYHGDQIVIDNQEIAIEDINNIKVD